MSAHPAAPTGVSEFDAIRRWVDSVPTRGPGVRLGPGDDVAVLSSGGAVAISTDTLVEGTHFSRETCSAEDVGWKALAAALSDLAASRSEPLGALVALTVARRDLDDGGWADGVMRGIGECARAFDCPVVGGDTTRTSGPAVIGVTVVGRGARVLTRGGACPGDLLLLSGEVGWAAAGLLGDGDERAQRALHRPRPRLDLLLALDGAHAAIDVSDGLLADAAHLAHASGATLVIDADAVIPPALVAAVGPDVARRCALAGGEDYELLVTAPDALPGFVVIGRVEAAEDVDLRWIDGRPVPTQERGWDHGARPR